jgi:hypothetical protein
MLLLISKSRRKRRKCSKGEKNLNNHYKVRKEKEKISEEQSFLSLHTCQKIMQYTEVQMS